MARYHYDNYDYNKDKDRALKTMYGISLAEYNEMLTVQGGVCAVCKQPEIAPAGRNKRTIDRVPMLHVDHCHTTGAIRGLLCTRCNTALGSLCEDPERVLALLKYIEERVLW